MKARPLDDLYHRSTAVAQVISVESQVAATVLLLIASLTLMVC